MEFPKNIVNFLQKPNFMVLSEHNPDKTIHSTIVWYEYSPKENIFRFSTLTERVKHRNLKNDPDVTFIILNESNMYRYVQIRGKATGYSKDSDYHFIDSEAVRYMGVEDYPHEPNKDKGRITYKIVPDSYFLVGFENSE